MNAKVASRLTAPGSPAYALEIGWTALPASSQTCGAASQPSRSTPAAAGSARPTTINPSQTASPSSVAYQDFHDGQPRPERSCEMERDAMPRFPIDLAEKPFNAGGHRDVKGRSPIPIGSSTDRAARVPCLLDIADRALNMHGRHQDVGGRTRQPAEAGEQGIRLKSGTAPPR